MKKIYFMFFVLFYANAWGASPDFINALRGIIEERIAFYGKIYSMLESRESTHNEKVAILKDLLGNMSSSLDSKSYMFEVYKEGIFYNRESFLELLTVLNSHKLLIQENLSLAAQHFNKLKESIEQDQFKINALSEKVGASYYSPEDINLEYLYLQAAMDLDVEKTVAENNVKGYLNLEKSNRYLNSTVKETILRDYETRPMSPTKAFLEITEGLVEVLGPERTSEKNCISYKVNYTAKPDDKSASVGGTFIPGPKYHRMDGSLVEKINRASQDPGPFQNKFIQLSQWVKELEELMRASQEAFTPYVKTKGYVNQTSNPLHLYLSVQRVLHLCKPLMALNQRVESTLKEFNDYQRQSRKSKAGKKQHGRSKAKNNSKRSFAVKKKVEENELEDQQDVPDREESQAMEEELAVEAQIEKSESFQVLNPDELAEIRRQKEEAEERKFRHWFQKWLWKEGYSEESEMDKVFHGVGSISLSESSAASEDNSQDAKVPEPSKPMVRIGRGPGLWVTEDDIALLEVFAGPRHLKNFKYRFDQFATLCKHFGGRISQGRTTGDHVALVLPDPTGREYKAGSFHPSSPKMPAIVFDHFMKAFQDAGYLDETGKVIRADL